MVEMSVGGRSRSVYWCVIGCAVAVLLSSAGCGGRRSEQARVLGDTHFALKEYAEARASYQRALELDSGNAAAHWGLGRCEAIAGNVNEAIKEFETATTLNPGLEAAWQDGVRVLLEAQRTAEAETFAKAYQARDAQRGGRLVAMVMMETRREADALALLKELAAAHPDDGAIITDYANAAMASGDLAAAEAALKPYVEGDGYESVAAQVLYGELLHQQGKAADRLAAIRRDVEARPDNQSLKLILASALADAGQIDDAEKLVRDSLSVQDRNQSGWAAYVMAKVTLGRADRQMAAEYIKLAAGALPDVVFVQTAGRTLVAQAETPAAPDAGSATPDEPKPSEPATASTGSSAWETLWRRADLGELCSRRDEFLSSGEANVAETIALAAMFIGDTATVNDMQGRLPEGGPVRSYIDAMLRIYGGARDEGALAGLRDVLASWNETDPKRQVLRENAAGFALAKVGLRAQSFARYSASIQQDPRNSVPLFNLATMYRSAEMPEFAAGCLRKLIVDHPEAKEARFVLYRVLSELDDLAGMRTQAEATRGLFPDDTQAILDLGSLYFHTGDLDLASDLLKQSIRKKPDEGILKLLYASVLLASSDVEGCLAQLDSIPAGSKHEAAGFELRAVALGVKGDWAGVESLTGSKSADNLTEACRLTRAASLVALGRTTDVASALPRPEGASAEYTRAAGVLLAALGDTSVTVGERDTGLVAALKGKPEASVDFSLGLALTKLNFHMLAYAAYDRVRGTIGNEPRVLSLMISSLARSPREPDRAAKGKSLVDAASDSWMLWLELSNLYKSVKDSAQERVALEKAVELAPDRPEIWFRVARYADSTGDNAYALTASQKLLELVPDDPGVKNNVAYYLLQTNGDVSLAVKYAQEAVTQLKSNASVLHTLGLAQMRAGDLAGARSNLRQALELRPGDPTILLDYGQILIESGDREDGVSYVRHSVIYADQLGVDFPRRAEAEALLRE